jgi:hypothetical protein
MSAPSSPPIESTPPSPSRRPDGLVVRQYRSIDDAFRLTRIARALGGDAEPVVVGDRYELLAKIGAGGYGSVYEAHDRQLARRVAVKVIALGDSNVAMREARALAEINHRHVVTIFDQGIGPDYRYFILELLDGPDLCAWCVGKSSAEIIAKYVEAASGLAAAHAKGLAHRDFKPNNVRLGSEGQAVVVDFGLVRHVAVLNREDATPDRFAGTISYAAPERLFGLPGDQQADVFSFCVALWWALSGADPFRPCTVGMSPEERMLAIFDGVVGRLPRGPRRVRLALARGLLPQREERWSSMEALIAAITPRPRRAWPFGKILAVGIAGVIAVGLWMPARGPLECVANARARWSGETAVMFAREGNADAALSALESAERAEQSAEISLMLARASGEAAVEFEHHNMSEPAAHAWHLMSLFARHADNHDLEQYAWQRGYAAVSVNPSSPH